MHRWTQDPFGLWTPLDFAFVTSEKSMLSSRVEALATKPRGSAPGVSVAVCLLSSPENRTFVKVTVLLQFF